MTEPVQKAADLIKRIKGRGTATSRVPTIFTRPKIRYSKIAIYRDRNKVLGASLLEVAKTAEERARGLMGRKELSPICGMLFEGLTGNGYFWMKDCLIPLDILFLDASGTVVRTYTMPIDIAGSKHYAYDDRSSRAIEVPSGFCAEHALGEGCTVLIRDLGGSHV